MPSWNDYYKCLNVSEKSTAAEISAAYESVVLTCHPNKKQELSKLKEAYGFLIKRAEYTRFITQLELDNVSYIREFEEQKLFYEMVDDPNKLDNYTFFNKFFNLSKNEALAPDLPLPNSDELWEKLTYVGHKIMRELKVLKDQHPTPNRKIRKRIKELKINEAKLGIVEDIFLNPKRKLIYDLTFDIVHNKELEEIRNLIGGKDAIIQLIKDDPALDSADGIFPLKKAKMLNPKNLKILSKESKKLWKISTILEDLSAVDLLNQENLDRLQKSRKNLHAITRSLSPLKSAGLFNQKFLDILIDSGKDAEGVAHNIACLKSLGLLSEETIKVTVSKICGTRIYNELYLMEKTGLITPIHSEIFNWQGPPDLSLLVNRIEQMFAYGLFLLTCDAEKGRTSMFLALKLKNLLKNYYALPSEQQVKEKETFGKSFLKLLHSENEVMTKHREEWKVIVANIFIAATIVGVFAIILNGGMFFNKTNRVKQRNAVEESFARVQSIA